MDFLLVGYIILITIVGIITLFSSGKIMREIIADENRAKKISLLSLSW